MTYKTMGRNYREVKSVYKMIHDDEFFTHNKNNRN